jgi:hypothetical protein
MLNKVKETLVFLSMFLAAASAGASYSTTSVYVAFSGGSSDYLTISFSETIALTTTSSASTEGLMIVLDGAGDLFGDADGANVTGTVMVGSNTYTSVYESSGFENNDVTSDDLYLCVSDVTISSGTTITISGSYTTTSTVSGTAPADGDYDLYITDPYGYAIPFTAVPEPSEYAGFAGVFVLGGAMLLRRRVRR